MSGFFRCILHGLKVLTSYLDKGNKKVKKLESVVSAKVTRLNELEGTVANDSEAVSSQRDKLEILRKEAGELEMQRHKSIFSLNVYKD